MLFKAKDGYRIIGGDFSAQEPRLTAYYSQDKNMIDAYLEDKDLYSIIASMSFDRKYEDCLEFYPEGTQIVFDGQLVTCGYKTHQNKEGKTYRTMAKSVLLGVLYGRGAASVGEQIGKSREEAQEIIDKFFKAFPSVHNWINKTISDAHKKGYVEDIAGRRRRLPDILLSKYEITSRSGENDTILFNPIIGCTDRINHEAENLISKYQQELSAAKYKRDIDAIKARAEVDHLEIKDNTGFIAQAERQAVNSRVQGGAATLTKGALISIFNDQRLKDIGAKLVNTVHDEILLEVPEENSERAEELLIDNMVNSAKQFVNNVPMKCDTYNVNCWYVDEYFVLVESEFKKLLDKGLSPIEAFEQECKDRCESTRSQIYEIIGNYLGDYIPEDVDTTYKSF